VKSNCGYCHTNPTSPQGWGKVPRKGIFLHSTHKDSISDCKKCHLVTSETKPSISGNHKICGECHEEHIKDMMCAKCHYEMVFSGLNQLNQFKHADNFLAEHGAFAKRSVRICSQCHREQFCLDCHSKKAGLKVELKYPEAVKRNFIHRSDYLTLHQIEAKTDSSDCLKCHAASECAACHKKDRASPQAKSPFFGHPAGWMAKGAANFHGDEARRDIVACATCHHAKGPGYCIDCHNTINPHPNGWENRASALDKSSKMCAKCHGK
jgi:hypothetical protein